MMLYVIFKGFDKEENKNKSNIKDIDNKIFKLETIEQCNLLQKDIKKYHSKTDIMLKDLRREYQHRYYIITGIKIMINKKNYEKK